MSATAIRLMSATALSICLLAACRNSDSGTTTSGPGLRSQEDATTGAAASGASLSDAGSDPLLSAPEVGDL